MKNYIISKEAVKDLEEITNYFLSINVEAGENFIKEFNKKCFNLTKFPYLGRNYEYITKNLRGISLLNYIIFYRVTEKRIEIIRVVSGYRDLDNLF